MSIRDAFENCLIELNKVQAPALLIDDFIYLFNKAVQQYVNERYNLFETKQQLTDDLRVLTRSKYLSVKNGEITDTSTSGDVFGGNYTCELPSDYFHILNCVCRFKDKRPKRCEDSCNVFEQGANKLDTNQWPHVINNYYMRPSVKQPYYYIINIKDPIKTGSINTDQSKDKITSRDQYGKEPRYGNSVMPIMQIKCGNDRKNFELEGVYIDYLKAPQYLSLDQDILDDVTDNSQIIEFPDYVIYEIINQIVKLILENGSNPRIQTNPAVSKTIA